MERGPSLVSLTQRLFQMPKEFLFSPILKIPSNRKNLKHTIYIPAIYSDLCYFIWNEFPKAEELKFLQVSSTSSDLNLLSIYSITIYLLHYPFFKNKPFLKEKVWLLFSEKLPSYKNIIKAEKFILDAEKREELSRFVLYHLGYIPLLETERYALERLTSLDSIERIKLVEATRKAQIAREEAIREAIRRREAEEAASRMSGE